MNERIRELAEQAGVFVGDFAGAGLYSIHNKDEVEKFVELIVRECLEVIQDESMDSGDDWETGLQMAKRAIVKHFGVEL